MGLLERREIAIRPYAASLLLAVAIAVGASAPALAQDAPEGSPPATGDPPAIDAAADGDAATPPADRRATTLSLRSSDRRVRAGDRIRFSGRRAPGAGNQVVELEYRPLGGAYHRVDTARTSSHGGFTFTADPRRSGVFRASTAEEAGDGTATSERVEVAAQSSLTIEARRHQLQRRGLKVRGRLDPGRSDRRIVLQRLTGKGWQTVDAAHTREDGSYRISWEGAKPGRYELRALFKGDPDLDGDRARLDHPVYVYREDGASYYGPGFYGNTTACGQVLRKDTVGVANRTLPCGTRVRFYYHGRTRKIEVIDRGPYVSGRRWDLTNAARRSLGFPKGVDQIWATK